MKKINDSRGIILAMFLISLNGLCLIYIQTVEKTLKHIESKEMLDGNVKVYIYWTPEDDGCVLKEKSCTLCGTLTMQLCSFLISSSVSALRIKTIR